MATPAKTHDSLGRSRRPSQGGAGPKHLPSKEAPKAGEFDQTPPDDLGDHGLAYWNESVKHLVAMGYIDQADRTYLIRASKSFHKLCKYDKIIEVEGEVYIDMHGTKKAHPLMNTVMKLECLFDTRQSSLGLSPSARAKFGANITEVDPFAELLEARKRN